MSLVAQVCGIRKTYSVSGNTLRVLKGVSLDISRGEAVAVVGMSGAGKSTLLHILGALDRPEEGRVVVNGKDVYGMTEGARSRLRATYFGFVFQSYHLLPEMDLLENVMLPARALCFPFQLPARARNRAQELLEAVGLGGRARHTPFELSGGEQQRAALARALMNDPVLVLADEPTGNLDQQTGAQILDRLFALTRDRGHSLVMVTHNEKVAEVCDRTMRLADGVLNPV